MKPSVLHRNALSLLFRPSFLEKVARGDHERTLRELSQAYAEIVNTGKTRIGDMLAAVYDELRAGSDYEYLYKNEILNQIILPAQRADSPGVILEFAVGRCRADVATFGDTSTAFEIKTLHDSFARLHSQMSTYARVFEFAYVVTSEHLVDSVAHAIGESVGIIAMSRGILREIRHPQSNMNCLDSRVMFDCLRKAEYESIIKRVHGFIPDVPNTKIYDACKELFVALNTTTAHRLFVDALKRRAGRDVSIAEVGALPYSLKSMYYEMNIRQRRRVAIASVLETAVSLQGW